MIALNFEDAVFQSASATAQSFKVAEQISKRLIRANDAGDERYRLAFALFRVAQYANDAIACSAVRCFLTNAVCNRLTT